MRTDEFDRATLKEVATWFYKDQVNKSEILRKLQARDPKKKFEIRIVTRMLRKALAERLVVIDFPDTPTRERKLEERLIDRFPHLQKVIIIPLRSDEMYENLLERWGQEAARYFDELVTAAQTGNRTLHVGMSGGETLFSFVNAVVERPRRNVHIHTTALVGHGEEQDKSSPKNTFWHINPLVNAQILWCKCGRQPGQCHYATVPPYGRLDRDSIDSELQSLSKRQPIGNLLRGLNSIDVAFAGLGIFSLPHANPQIVSRLTNVGLLEHIVSADTLIREGVLGDVSYCLFDRRGETKKAWEFFLTAGYGTRLSGIEFFKEMVRDSQRKKKVVVMAGSQKQQILIPALKAQLFNVWITDDEAAKWVLRNSARS